MPTYKHKGASGVAFRKQEGRDQILMVKIEGYDLWDLPGSLLVTTYTRTESPEEAICRAMLDIGYIALTAVSIDCPYILESMVEGYKAQTRVECVIVHLLKGWYGNTVDLYERVEWRDMGDVLTDVSIPEYSMLQLQEAYRHIKQGEQK
jgi:hypothetical protein